MTTSVATLRGELLDQTSTMPARFRALFSLRSAGGTHAVSALLDGLEDPSALFRHEVAFALGQMQASAAAPALRRVLADASEHSMVRHEAAEALGAINDGPESLCALETASLDETQVVRETAQLALHRIRLKRDASAATAVSASAASDTHAALLLGSAKERLSAPSAAATPSSSVDDASSPYISVDPIPAAPATATVDTLAATLLDEGAEMHDRYAAMFALRNRNPARAAKELAAVLVASRSALLKHEACYVLGQLQDTDPVRGR